MARRRPRQRRPEEEDGEGRGDGVAEWRFWGVWAARGGGRAGVWGGVFGGFLAAAGRGERLGSDRPKAFAKLRERPLLAESLERLEASAWIDAIVIVAPPGWEEPSILVAEELGCGKVSACVAGGEARAESVRAGVAEVGGDAAVIV